MQLFNLMVLASSVPIGPRFLKLLSVGVGRGTTVLRVYSSGGMLEPTTIKNVGRLGNMVTLLCVVLYSLIGLILLYIGIAGCKISK